MGRIVDLVRVRLLALYRRYIGEPERLRDVYLGFGLFFGGIAFAGVGVLVFLWSSAYPESADVFWQLREIAITLSAVGLPTFLSSLVVLLPVDRRAKSAAAIGSVICLIGVAMFVLAYPYNWNVSGADASAQGVATYALGLVVLVASIGSALVTDYIERANADASASAGGDAGATAATTDAGGSAADDGEKSVSEAQVARDIEDAMAEAELSWGGVEKADTKRLTFTTNDVENDIDTSSFDRVGANESRAEGEGVDDAVSSLQQFRGEETDQATGEGTDQQADALAQLREQQTEQEQATEQNGLSDRLRDRLGL
jgi:hypothetical protein